jgi:hypothetical protein
MGKASQPDRIQKLTVTQQKKKKIFYALNHVGAKIHGGKYFSFRNLRML